MIMSFMLAESPAAPVRRFAELSVVALTHSIEIGGQRLPTGAKGTVVAAYAEGAGYEVEFEQPFPAVLTLAAGDLAD